MEARPGQAAELHAPGLPPAWARLLLLLVQRVDITGGAVVKITWTPAPAAFFEASAQEALVR